MSSGASLDSAGARPLRFALVGVANTAAGLAAIYFCKAALGLGDVAANAAGYAFGLALSFALNASWTFRYRGAMAPAVLRFIMSFIVAYGANLAAVLLLIDRLGVNAYVAQAIGVLPYTVAFYLLSKRFVFRA